MSTLPSPAFLFSTEQRPPELWFIIWKLVAKMIHEEYSCSNRHAELNNYGPPFYSRIDKQLREDPKRRRAKLVYAASYSAALQEYGPELYEHVVLISYGAVKAMLDCARQSTLRHVRPNADRAPWVKHIDLILSDKESAKVDWVATQQAWSGFPHLETLTLCYHPKDPAPLNSYIPIAAHLPPSLKLLRLRPWGEGDGSAPQFDQKLKGGAKGRILRPRQDFWWSSEWAVEIQAFQNIPNIHLHAVVYVVWPPYSQQAAEKVFSPWTARVDGGRLCNISVTLFPVDEGQDIQDAIQELDGDLLSEGKKYGYLPQDAEEVDDSIPDVLCYDWRIGHGGIWEVDLSGSTASRWGMDYGTFSYHIGEKLDHRQEWSW